MASPVNSYRRDPPLTAARPPPCGTQSATSSCQQRAKIAPRCRPALEHHHANFYVAGDEPIAWDETFTLPSGDALRQVTVGCTSGFSVSSPSRAARQRAACERQGARGTLGCTMTKRGRFELARDRSQRMIEHDASPFTVFTVTGGDLQVTPMTVDDGGHLHAFYLSDP